MNKMDCCGSPHWLPVSDMPSTQSSDFVLGRCERCNQYWMHVFCVSSAAGTGCKRISEADARHLQALPLGHEKKQAIADWFDRHAD